MNLRANQLTSHLRSTLAPCYLISGDEHLLVNEALDEIRAAARSNGFESRDLFTAITGFDWAQLGDTGANLSLFAERRLIELRLPTGKPGQAGARAIGEFVEQLGPDLMLIVVTPKLDRSAQSSKWVKTLAGKGAHLTIWPIAPRELPGWIAQRMRAVELQPDRTAVQMIADRVEGNLLAAGQEIEKLRLLLGAGEVSADDVSKAVADSSRYDVFKLMDAALAGDARKTLRMLAGLRAEGVEPVIVVWAVSRELRTLAALDDQVRAGTDLGAALQRSGVWRNRQPLVRSCLGRHGNGRFHQLLKRCSDADQTAKGQQRGDPWQVLTDLLLGLTVPDRQVA